MTKRTLKTKRTTRAQALAMGLRSGYEADVLAANSQLNRSMYEPRRIRFTMTQVVNKLPDLILPNGAVVELKGLLQEEEKRRLLSFHHHLLRVTTSRTTKLLTEHAPLRYSGLSILFQSDRPVRKGAKLTYTGWAAKHGIRCAVGLNIPKEWWE